MTGRMPGVPGEGRGRQRCMQASPEHVDAALEALVSARVEQRLAAARQEAMAEMAEVVMDARRCGRTVMAQAACTGRTAVLTVLVRQSIAAGAHLLLKSDRSVAFLDAASSGQEASLRVLLELASEELVRATNSRGANALTLAASNGHVSCVTALLQHSPDVQVAAAATAEGLTAGPPIHKGFTALMAATRSGQPACMRALLAHCPTAQVAAVDARRWSALVTAARHCRVECVALLLAHSPNLQRLDKALSAAARAASKLVAASVTDGAAGAADRQVPAPAPISAALLPFHRCMELLLAQVGGRETPRPLVMQADQSNPRQGFGRRHCSELRQAFLKKRCVRCPGSVYLYLQCPCQQKARRGGTPQRAA